MRVSTAVNLAAVVVFWVLMIIDWTTPGDAPKSLDIMIEIAVYVMIGSLFYGYGLDRGKKMSADPLRESA